MARPRICSDAQLARLVAWRQGQPRRSYAFIAQRLGVSKNTVRYQWLLAQERLQAGEAQS